MKDQVSIMIDTSGAGLHKRGYRANSTDAPIKETLATAMANLSRVRVNGQYGRPVLRFRNSFDRISLICLKYRTRFAS